MFRRKLRLCQVSSFLVTMRQNTRDSGFSVICGLLSGLHADDCKLTVSMKAHGEERP